MQIFELHFNPRTRDDHFFDSFVYEPENIYEKKLGSLFAVGELKNALPQNSKLLDNLARAIKNEYYTLSLKTPEKAMSEGLKKANDFLAQEIKKENVSWLGNLNFALISLKSFDLIFTKSGNLKIVLIRGGKIIDIGKNLDLQEIEPYPLKIFFNLVSGKLATKDIILVFTKEIYDFFLEQKLLEQISRLEPMSRKKIKELLSISPFSQKNGGGIFGICFLVVLNQGVAIQKGPKEIFLKREKKFLFPKIFTSFKKPFQKIRRFSFKKCFLKKPKLKMRCSLFSSMGRITKIPTIKKKLILIFILLFLLLLGFLIF